jgi:uncharacterized membrane protein
VLILAWIFNGIDNILQPPIESLWGRYYPGIGIAALVIIIFLAGILASNVLGKIAIKWGESVLERIPVVGQLYNDIKQILDSFITPGKDRYMDVVLVEFPRKGMHSIGFITNKLPGKDGEYLLSVFIPTSPNPTSGFLEIMPEKEVIRTDISVDNALKMIVSAGKASRQVGEKITSKAL